MMMVTATIGLTGIRSSHLAVFARLKSGWGWSFEGHLYSGTSRSASLVSVYAQTIQSNLAVPGHRKRCNM